MSHDPISFRVSEEKDAELLAQWLLEPGVLQWFPLADLREIEDAAKLWVSYRKHGAALTVFCNGEPCGCATLYLQPFQKLAHQCLFAIIVNEAHRGRGIGTRLLKELMELAKEKFHIRLLHLEVYEGNPAIHLYERMGFTRYGRQKRFIKEDGRYLDKILMQKAL